MHSRCRLIAMVSFAALLSPALHATDFTLAGGEVKGTLKTRVVAGAGVRLNDPSKHLVGKGFRSDGKPKGGDGADTADDGNLNYGKGDVYSSLFKVVSSLDLSYRNVGIVAAPAPGTTTRWKTRTCRRAAAPVLRSQPATRRPRPVEVQPFLRLHVAQRLRVRPFRHGR